ncbi:zinc metallochaperone AztD [Nocardioides sp. Arc9.136]|uniref:zinc metallochaperone AztD n=1 Tax=Nocardioides sp. Arc9.136 TaxID=2996826 RepID=UPI0026671408|nr:zinc metallochaperone AztD [Nocardioides sp. Arc9.136]WKN48688.1 zinc metallochaperone AztD [Nocardioides sp. Arc9.136]
MHRRPTRGLRGTAALAVLTFALAACGGTEEESATSEDAPETTAAAATTQPRLAVTYEDGVAVLDGETLEVLEEFETEEFTRVNAVGDGQHVLLTTSEGFQVIDTQAPELTDAVFAAEAAGHVVRHGEHTILFADGTGETTIFETDALLAGEGELPETTGFRAPEAHHGVSIVLEDGTLLTTIGDEETRSGAMALEPDGEDWTETARNEECPGVHGEGTAAGEAVVFGCEDGALLYRDGAFEKLQAPDEFGRMGNAYVSETSPLVVGDYKTDPDAEGYELTQVALIDTEQGTLETVDLPKGVAYTWRGVVRGPDDLAYLLGTDGAIHVLDPATGEITDDYPVIDPWEGPADWQDPHPALTVDGDTVYVADPATNQVHAVDLTTGETTASVELDHEPNEMAANLG